MKIKTLIAIAVIGICGMFSTFSTCHADDQYDTGHVLATEKYIVAKLTEKTANATNTVGVTEKMQVKMLELEQHKKNVEELSHAIEVQHQLDERISTLSEDISNGGKTKLSDIQAAVLAADQNKRLTDMQLESAKRQQSIKDRDFAKGDKK